MKRAAAMGLGGALLLAGLGHGLAEAKPQRDPVLGDWRFETTVYDGGCKMTGAMTITRGASPGTYACRFTATEVCPSVRTTARQTCTATRSGDALEVTSTIVALAPPDSPYVPDDWTLTIRSASRMTGELRSADIAPVEFFRARPIPTS